MFLNSRQKDIAHQLLYSSKIYKVKDLATNFNVSTRTLRNDLVKIAAYINQVSGCKYVAKRGKGIWVEYKTEASRQNALHGLNDFSDHQNYLTPEERQRRILTSLIFANRYLTGSYFKNNLFISRNTLLSDLDSVAGTLQKFNLNLKSKNYYGYAIKGDEIDKRNLMEFIIQKNLDQYSFSTDHFEDFLLKLSVGIIKNEELPEFIKEIVSSIALYLIDLISRSDLNENYELTSTVKSMINRLSIIIFRNQNNHIFLDDSRISNISIPNERIYKKIYLSIVDLFFVKPQIVEEKYFILGGRLFNKYEQSDKLAEKIIIFVSKKLSIDLTDDIKLKDALTQHLMNKINGNYQYISEYTPFTAEIKNRYSELFDIVDLALKKYITPSPVVINDTFVTLITLHFLVVINDSKYQRKIKIMYVCSTGLGAASILQKMIQEQVANTQTVGFASLTNYQIKSQELKPDLIISIFPLKIMKIPVIQINPIPNNNDITLVQNEITHIRKQLKEVPLYLSNSIDQNNYKSDQDKVVEQVLTLSMKVYLELKEYFGNRISEKYQDAFMIHCQLATERVFFQKQYQIHENESLSNNFEKVDVNRIENIFKKLNLSINESETLAILRYTQLL